MHVRMDRTRMASAALSAVCAALFFSSTGVRLLHLTTICCDNARMRMPMYGYGRGLLLRSRCMTTPRRDAGVFEFRPQPALTDDRLLSM